MITQHLRKNGLQGNTSEVLRQRPGAGWPGLRIIMSP